MILSPFRSTDCVLRCRYCNNEDTFGTTAVRPGGFLSQLDSQPLLTYDVRLPG